MADASAALATLQGILGDSATQEECRALLQSAPNNDVQAALNAFYDRPIVTKRPSSEASNQPPTKQLKLGESAGSSAAGSASATAATTAAGSASATAATTAASASSSSTSSVSASSAPAPSNSAKRSSKPLAERMRPVRLDDLLGQSDALGSVLSQALANDRLPSLILWGPPGCGKTSFAACVAASTQRLFRSLSAAKAGVAEIREELGRAASAARLGQATILFVDEIHRWSKAQQARRDKQPSRPAAPRRAWSRCASCALMSQDALLLDSERGTVTLIGTGPGLEARPASPRLAEGSLARGFSRGRPARAF